MLFLYILIDVILVFDSGAKFSTECLISIAPSGVELEEFEGKEVTNAFYKNEGKDNAQLVIELSDRISIILSISNPPFPYYCCAELELPGVGIISFGLDESETG